MKLVKSVFYGVVISIVSVICVHFTRQSSAGTVQSRPASRSMKTAAEGVTNRTDGVLAHATVKTLAHAAVSGTEARVRSGAVGIAETVAGAGTKAVAAAHTTAKPLMDDAATLSERTTADASVRVHVNPPAEVSFEASAKPSAEIHRCHTPRLPPRFKAFPRYTVSNMSDHRCAQRSPCPKFSVCTKQWLACVPEGDGELQAQEIFKTFTSDLALIRDVMQSSQGHVFTLTSASTALLHIGGGCTHKVPLNMGSAVPQCIPRAASVVYPYGDNFFHFVTDVLPRYVQLGAVLEAERSLPVVTNSVQHMYLAHLLLQQRNVSTIPLLGKGKSLYFKELVLPQGPQCGAGGHPWMRILRQRYLTAVQPKFLPPGAAGLPPRYIAVASRTGGSAPLSAGVTACIVINCTGVAMHV